MIKPSVIEPSDSRCVNIVQGITMELHRFKVLKPNVTIGIAMWFGLVMLFLKSDAPIGWLFMLVGVIELIAVLARDRLRGRNT